MPSPITTQLADRLVHARTTVLEMVRSIPDDRLGDVPAQFDKNAAWLIGHLHLADDLTLSLLGADRSGLAAPSKEHSGHFGPGSPGTVPLSIFRAALGSGAEAATRLEAGHARLVDAVRALPDSALARPITEERVRAYFPDVGTLLLYMLWHDGWHAGQLSQWCKALGLGKPPTG